jgi:hypothetical protein
VQGKLVVLGLALPKTAGRAAENREGAVDPLLLLPRIRPTEANKGNERRGVAGPDATRPRSSGFSRCDEWCCSPRAINFVFEELSWPR